MMRKAHEDDCVGQFSAGGCVGYSVATAGRGYEVSEYGSGGGVHDGAEC